MPAKKNFSQEQIEHLRNLVEVQKLQQWRVSEITGIPRKKVSKFCKRYGIVSQRTGPRSGEGHPNWKGGRMLIGGYWYIYSPNHPHVTKQRRVAEHRLVMERELGRYLDPSEVVHHKDGDSQNNAPENLILFQHNADHLRHELKGKCPQWAVEGKKKVDEVCRQNAIRRRLKSDDCPQLLPTDHQTS